MVLYTYEMTELTYILPKKRAYRFAISVGIKGLSWRAFALGSEIARDWSGGMIWVDIDIQHNFGDSNISP